MAQIGVSIGRMRVTRAVVTPSEAGYIKHMADQAWAMEYILQDAINKVKGVTPAVILEAIEPIERKSQERVPYRTGRLSRSFFKEARQTVNGVKAQIGYAKHGQPWYAAMVHESTHKRFGAHDGVRRQAKFLESAINEEVDNFFKRMAYLMTVKAGFKGNKYG